MKIKKLRTSMGPPGEGVTRAGQILDVPDHRARQLIDKGLARAVIEGEGSQQLSAAPKPVGRATLRPGKRPEVETAGPLALEETADGHFRIGKAAPASSSPAAPAPTAPGSNGSDRPKAKKSRTRKAKE